MKYHEFLTQMQTNQEQTMSESAPAAIPTDFFTAQGFVKSCGMSSHPGPGDTVVIDGRMYTVKARSWDFDTGGMPVLIRINIED